MSAENAWRIAMEAGAEWSQQCQTESASEYFRGWHSARREMAAALPTLPMPPAFRAAVEAEAEELRGMLAEELRKALGMSDRYDDRTHEDILRDALSRLEAKGEGHE